MPTNNRINPTPVMCPDIPELKLPELKSIEEELAKDSLCQGMEEFHGYTDLVVEHKTKQLNKAFALPQGFSEKADDLLVRFRNMSGIEEVKLFLFPEKGADPREVYDDAISRYQIGGDLAVYDKSSEVWSIGLPATVFEQRNQNEALFLMGRAVWRELNVGVPYDCMLKLSSPVGFWQRVKISKLLRFREIAANSLGMLYCRNLESASNALLHLELGLDASALQCNPGFYATLDNIDTVEELELLNRELPVIPAAPLNLYAMGQFAKTDLFQSNRVGLRANSSLSMDDYFADVQRANDHIHPPLREMPEEDKKFRERFLILAQYMVAEADEVIMKEETQAIMRSVNREVLTELEEEYNWKTGKNGNTAEVSFEVYSDASPEVRARHAAEILFYCVKTSRSDGDQCEEEVEVLKFLAEKLGVDLMDLIAIDSKATEIAEAEMVEAEEDEEEIIRV